MARPIHYQTEQGWKNYPNKTACGDLGFNVTDTETVTCIICLHTPAYEQAAAQFREVVDALAYPKEDHPCLKHQPSSTSPRGT